MAGEACSSRLTISLLQVLVFLVARVWAQPPQVPPEAINRSPCNTVSALFVFGDSTVDAGNNNYLATALKSNFPPYGRDFLGHLPTGRFTNGRLATDFVASYLGIKDMVPPYLDWTLPAEELKTGVSFASAGSGFDILTAQMTGLFKDYLFKLDLLVGRRRSEDLIKRAVFVVSAGTNDFVVNYLTIPLRQQKFSLVDYQAFLLHNVRVFIEALIELGAQKIIMVGLPPMGCLPIVITLKWKGVFHDRGCVEAYNSISMDYNEKLQKIIYADIYTPVLDMVTSPSKFGFTEAMSGCCGTGLVEAAILCNLKSVVCEDASRYVFWDSIHPTEKCYFIAFNSMRHLIDRVC
ncbi:unnamed protein product [Spirodela intermedia]|uniref:Uncharacterized protein n=1 Tax=Spirodela intermedia TaxID=51605 RepID=A0A7I8J6R4_SPIIN|nr:unnamed protein product [Spirodela intermedia]CAA6665801.1 unnamed protein product [Spirodela intermedia]